MEPLDLTRAGTAMVDYGVALPEFDYTSFFQDQEVNYLAAGSSSNSDSVLGAAFSSDASAPDAPSPSKKAASQKQKLERRGHTKSRRGCYNCKRRRVKVVVLFHLLQPTKPATYFVIVSRDTSCLRPLSQDGTTMRIPCCPPRDSPS